MKHILLLTLFLSFTFLFGQENEEEKIEYYEHLLREAYKNAATYEFPTDASQYYSSSKRRRYGSFDFVIIGSGAAGSVVANRLSEVKKWNILVLEAGHYGNNLSNIPGTYAPIDFTDFNWAYNSTPQTTVCLGFVNNVCLYPRGKGVGGSSLINGQVYARGYKADYDAWAKIVGDKRWAYETVLNYLKKSENFTHRDPGAPYDPAYHGKGGYLHVEFHLYNSPLLSNFLAANKELGYSVVDYNANKLGVSPTQQNTFNGRRYDEGLAFVQSAEHRKNLKVLTNSYVTKIRINKNDKTATGVEFTHNGQKYYVEAKKEVILSAGAISSPQILMQSGVGPRAHLDNLGIDVIEDLAVGNNLRDNAAFYGLTFSSNYTEPNISLREQVKEFLHGVGPLAIAGNTQGIGFYESSRTKDTGVPEIELEFIPPIATNVLNQRYFGLTDESYEELWKYNNASQTFLIYVIDSHARSAGNVRLRSRNPFVYPLIDSKFLSDPENIDIDTMYEGIQLALKLVITKPFKAVNAKLQGKPLKACRKHKYLSKNYWYCALRQLTVNLYHPSGTCSMGTDPKKGAVVDSTLKVFGISHLRIADTSVIPISLAAHTNAPTVMVGEQLGDIIKNTYKNEVDN